MECRAFYRRDGAEHLKSVGETELIAKLAAESRADTANKASITGIVSHSDLTLGGDSPEPLLEALEQHRSVGDGLLRGIRHSAARDRRPEDLLIVSAAPSYLHGKESFRKGLRIIADKGLSYDTWHYHHQNLDFLDFARGS